MQIATPQITLVCPSPENARVGPGKCLASSHPPTELTNTPPPHYTRCGISFGEHSMQAADCLPQVTSGVAAIMQVDHPCVVSSSQRISSMAPCCGRCLHISAGTSTCERTIKTISPPTATKDLSHIWSPTRNLIESPSTSSITLRPLSPSHPSLLFPPPSAWKGTASAA